MDCDLHEEKAQDDPDFRQEKLTEAGEELDKLGERQHRNRSLSKEELLEKIDSKLTNTIADLIVTDVNERGPSRLSWGNRRGSCRRSCPDGWPSDVRDYAGRGGTLRGCGSPVLSFGTRSRNSWSRSRTSGDFDRNHCPQASSNVHRTCGSPFSSNIVTLTSLLGFSNSPGSTVAICHSHRCGSSGVETTQ